MSAVATSDRAEATSPPAWRSIAFVVAIAYTWITLHPFGDLGAADALDLASGTEFVGDVCLAALAAFCLFLVASSDVQGLRSLQTPAFMGLAGWMVLSCVTSQDISRSVMRLTICACIATLAATLPLLPRGRFHLAKLLTAGAAALLGLSYFGVVFNPQYAIHQASDVVEPALAGDWRGVFSHKNDASVMFVMVFYIGIYIARRGHDIAGVAIAVLSFVFVIFAAGKAANQLWSPTLALSFVIARPGGDRWRKVVALTPLVILSLFGIGSVIFAPIGAIVSALPIDSTFTGRVDVWRFALSRFGDHPFLGHGFSAFWDTEAIRYGLDEATAWVALAAHAHNGYLDAAMSMGFVGLCLTLWALVAQPLADIRTATRAGADPALVLMLTQIWLFGVYISCFESFLFDRTNPIWFTFLFAVFGLRYVASFRSRP